MKQYEAVIQTLEKLGGQATLAQLYQETLKIPGVTWGTKTPFASIRRIIQVRPEIFKVRAGLWALETHRSKLGIPFTETEGCQSPALIEQSHSYYQGLLAIIGNLRGFSTFVPNQDKNKLWLQRPLAEIRTLHDIPQFSYEFITRRAATVDVSWFNNRLLPHSFFEIEHSTSFQNSLLKFHELQDFSARMVIVAAPERREEFQQKIRHQAFKDISNRLAFYDYESLAKDYEYEAIRSSHEFKL